MRIKMDVWLELDYPSAQRFLKSMDSKERWATLDLICNTRPDLVSFANPIVAIDPQEGASDEAPAQGTV